MIGIVIVAHGGLAAEYLAATEHVVGPCPDAVAIPIMPDDVPASKQAEVDAAVAVVDSGAGVVLLTDLFGGTPSNLAVRACRGPEHRVIYGVNMPLLIKLAKARHLPVDDAVACALTTGRKYINALGGFGVSPASVAH